MINTSIQQVFQQIKDEFRINSDGRVNSSIRGTARLANVSVNALLKAFEQADQQSQPPLAKFLISQGVEADQQKQFSQNGIPDIAVAFILEYYAYECQKRYQKQQAKQVCRAFRAIGFREWVKQQKGFYQEQQQQQQFQLPQTYSEALRQLANEWDSHQETKKQLKSAESTLDTYRAILSPESCLDIKQIADALNVSNMGRNNLFKYLRAKTFIVQNDVVPYHTRIQQELAVVETKTVEIKGEKHTKQKTKLTFRGLEWLIQKLEKDGYTVDKTAKQVWDYHNAELVTA